MLRATYRLQLTPTFGLDDAAALAPYLRDLGVSHLYLSPIFEARAGSQHGYDVTDPTRVRTALGGDDALRRLGAAARDAGLGLVLDIVPNHVAADATNPFWADVLRHGPSSRWASMFDIDWAAGDGRVRLPILGEPLAALIAEGAIALEPAPNDPAGRVVRYGDHRLPLDPATTATTVEGDDVGAGESGPPTSTVERATVDLAALLARQHYELCFWRDGLELVNYRRFFDIAELAAVRVEDPEIFRVTHERLARIVAGVGADAVRVDHVDGLRNPGAYLRDLRALLDEAGPRGRDAVILVEKILQPGEALPAGWPVAGTTGYEAMRCLTNLAVDRDGYEKLRDHAGRRLRLTVDFDPMVDASKRAVIDRLLGAELRRLVAMGLDAARSAAATAAADGAAPPDEASLRAAIVEVTVALPVYRTYVEDGRADEADRGRLAGALDRARRAIGAEHAGLRLVAALLDPDGAADGGAFRAAWQQFTGPVMAKGFEDTALYRHVVLVSLNEVGGEPVLPDDAIADFHATQARRVADGRPGLTATSTHDTKRGEDTRARISVLSEFADQWTAALDRWMAWHAGLRRRASSGPSPAPAEEVLLYQSLLGIWPADGEIDEALATRLGDYLIKASREARRTTSWRDPDDEHEAGLRAFTRRVLLGGEGERFRVDAVDLHRKTAFFGAINGLTQCVLRSTLPGAADVYQGAERWDLSLVDPDNRRPIDFGHARRLLDGLDVPSGPDGRTARRELLGRWTDGRIKLWTIRATLSARAARPELFVGGDYLPLSVEGGHARRVLAFARRREGALAVVVVPRLVARLARVGTWPVGRAVWGDARVRLPDGGPRRLVDACTGTTSNAHDGVLEIGDALAELPFAVLVDA